MRSIAYIARWDASRESGVLKKMLEQVRLWIALGHEAKLFLLSPSEQIWSGVGATPVEVIASRSLFDRGRAMRHLVGKALDWRPDVAYLRFTTHYFPLERLMSRVPTVLEINTDDVSEYGLYLPRYKYWYHRATRDRILKNAAGIVCVTHEIAEKFASYGVPVSVVGNGIDLARYGVLPAPSNPGVRAVFVGTDGASWHGVDKILEMAECLPDWRIDLIGPVLNDHCPRNVIAHGPLPRNEYEQIVAEADIAIGTLALHRNQMMEACPLKVREYLAFGLPCVIGYSDTDFLNPPPFLLQLPNTPENVRKSLSIIREFGVRWKGARVAREEIGHLDISAKEARRLALFETIRDWSHASSSRTGRVKAGERRRTASTA